MVPVDDVNLGGTSDIIASNGVQAGEFIHFKFQRLLNTGDPLDRILDKNDTIVVVAYNRVDTDARKHHGWFVRRNVKLFSFKTPTDPFIIFRFHYIVLVVYILFVIVLALSQKIYFSHFFKRTLFAQPSHAVLSFLFSWITNITIAEVLIILGFLIVNVCWLVVGIFDAYIPFTGKPNIDIRDIIEMACKFTGYLAILQFSFVLLPVVKNSFSLFIFGVSFEKAIKMHRWISKYLYTVISLHGALQVTLAIWGKDYWTIFSTDIKGSGTGFIFAGFASWVIFTVMICFTFDPIRKWIWEAFSYTHYLVYPAIIMACVHDYLAAIHVAAGLALHILDWIVRYVNFLLPTSLFSSKTFGDITHLEIVKNTMSFSAGQYAYLWIPEVSLIQAHPFSMSSLPSSPTISFNIRNMGKGTWTGKLHELVSQNKEISVRMHGPYGNINLDNDVIVLMCGGIGATPFISILSHLWKQNSKKVYFNWTVKKVSDFKICYELLYEINLAKNPNFELALNVSNKEKETSTLINQRAELIDLPYEIGRPSIDQFLKKIKFENLSKNLGAYVCGPREMVADVSQSSRSHGYNLHFEEFEY
jgi:ferric-chelate reductase